MPDLIDVVAKIISFNGGEIVGKTRLQKIFYLLDEKELVTSLDFDYHNYGPFSVDLAFATDDAVALGYLEQEVRQGYHAVSYTVYRLVQKINTTDDTNSRNIAEALKTMSRFSALVLELAATARFLQKHGYETDFWDEVRKRKPGKASDSRIQKARELLTELCL